MIDDNDKGWVYYGAEANDRPLQPWDKSQMKPEDFDKDAITLKCSCYYPNAGDIGHGIHWEIFNFLEHQLDGKVKFDRYFGQSLHGLNDGWKALRSGLVDVGQIYHSGVWSGSRMVWRFCYMHNGSCRNFTASRLKCLCSARYLPTYFSNANI